MTSKPDIAALRRDFPLIADRADLVYLDNAATTQKPQAVVDAIAEHYRSANANVHRAAHALSGAATEAFEAARGAVARRIHAGSPNEVVWTKGTTEAINLVAASYAPTVLGRGDNVVITRMEHHSNIVPWQVACERAGAELKAVDVSMHGIDQDDLAAKVDERTRIVAVVHVSNVLGVVNDIPAIARLAREVGAAVVVDGAQAMAHLDVDVAALGCDFYAFSAHKMYGPTGIGALWGREHLLEGMPPWQTGGEMIEEVRIERTSYAGLPFRFEAGTPNIAGAVGIAAAADYLGGLDGEAVRTHETELVQLAESGLRQVEGLEIIGPGGAKGPVVSFTIEGAHPQDIGTLLDQQDIAVRTGHHCAMPLMETLGLPGTVRASFALYNSPSDVERFVQAVRKAREFL
ncbi:MAG: SufS family cysteine desulfurase [Gammaproteobacteria bacterium]|nr:SufS family cysteine desulfurase [Gammaproteobacteria bacterium]MYB37570.1 SufS family cysteine desulfurase [Gammaproteobacteria bacterium]